MRCAPVCIYKAGRFRCVARACLLDWLTSVFFSDSWCGCTNGEEMRPRAKEWDEEYGEPKGVCKETQAGSGIYEREWTKATVQWDCATAHGKISAK